MLITELSYFLLLLALVVSIMQVVLPSYGIFTNKPSLQNLAQWLAGVNFFALLLSFLGLMAGFYYNDFSIIYIANHSNSLLPWYYKLSATWSGHEGSLLLWITILAGWGATIAKVTIRGKQHLPRSMLARTLVILAAIESMMLLMLITSSSPFKRSMINGLIQLPIDGADLNPLLQDFGLIIHPPLLYMGYVGMAIPFAFCVAALWAGRLDSAWLRWSRPWTLLAWASLTLGIALGSWWAYYELGWGGWWFWDPVENASLMPWLICTALIHSSAVSEKRGVFKAWTIMLAIFAFALSLLGTFLVRSGVIASVHSFAADPSRGMFILIILAISIGTGLSLFAWRGWQLTVESNHQLRSRESLLVINNIILLIATLVVLLGTLYPIIADAVGWGQVSVGLPYFNALFVPLTWLLLLAMGIGVVTRWKRDRRSLLSLFSLIITSILVLVAVVALLFDFSSTLNVLMTLALCLWVAGCSFYDIKDKSKNIQGIFNKISKISIRYWGMQLAHLGVIVCAMGIALTSSESIEKDVAMGVGDTVEIKGYAFTMNDIYQLEGNNYDAIAGEIIVSKKGQQVASLHPEKRTYVVSMMPMTETAIDANIWRDLYVAMGEPIYNTSKINKKNDSKSNGNRRLPNIDPSRLTDDAVKQLATEKWAVRIYVKPFIRWVWLGALLMAMGGVISIFDKKSIHR